MFYFCFVKGKKVVVGLSGGVDSSVTAHLLVEQGYDVVGIFMRNWHDESVTIADDCPWIEDSQDAMMVAERLGIPFQVLDLSEEYKTRIVDYMFDEYKSGRTPNPDVLCNREIKFDVFLEAAMKIGADYVATGHYCRKESFESDGRIIHRLLGGLDQNKDQSYFLCQLNQDQLSKALFPIGEMQKSEVREIAKELDLVTAEKKDSQGLCFIGKVKLPTFLQQALEPKKGVILEISEEEFRSKRPEQIELEQITSPYDFTDLNGLKVAEHQGAHYYTIGQRKGLHIGGRRLPSFVLGIDIESNTIYSGQGENHPGLMRKGLSIKNEDVHWIREDLKMRDGEERSYELRIRYRQTLFSAKLIQKSESLYILFDEEQRSVAPGQFAAWYCEGELLGSGVIA